MKFTEHALLTIDEVSGMLDHSSACEELVLMAKNPIIPLHPQLREYTLQLLRDLVPLNSLQLLCRKWSQDRFGTAPGNEHYRFTLTGKDSTSLYRTLARESGIPQRSSAEANLDYWFRPDKPQPPSPLLTDSCLYYKPLGLGDGDNDRFLFICSTPEQRKMAWLYGHKKQILTDLTFGVCSARCSLLIIMAIDDHGVGIPIAFIIFTAQKSAKAVHADYNGALLEVLFRHWKSAMGTNNAGESFEPLIANTDNDTRERRALERTWPSILLLLCLFHTWQSWRNGMNKYLRIIPKGDTRQKARSHLGKFLMHLLKEITDYDQAISAYNVELQYFKSLGIGRANTLSKKTSKGGLAFLAYLKTYLNIRGFWLSWSRAGALEAALRLGVPVEKIARTNNHLESFNGRIKGKWFAPYIHSGRLPRIDHWILTMITKVLPSFFEERIERRRQHDYFLDMRCAAPDPSLNTSRPTGSSFNTASKSSTPTHTATVNNPAETSICEITAEIEAELLGQLQDDNESDSEQPFEDADDVEAMEGYGTELSFEKDECNSNITTDFFDHDNALDDSSIIADLPADISVLFPFTSAQSNNTSFDSLDDLDGLDLLCLSPLQNQPAGDTVHVQETAHLNQETTSYQELVAKEDELVQAIRQMILSSSDPNIEQKLSPHISPRVRDQLSLSSHSSPSPPKVSTFSLELPIVDEILAPNRLRQKSGGFDPQTKERRKESHGIR